MSTHDCIATTNALLKPRNTALASAISFSAPTRELIQVTTVKADSSLRGKPVVMFASFCPFCGVKLNVGAAP